MIRQAKLRHPGRLDIAPLQLLEVYVGNERCVELQIRDGSLRQFVTCSALNDCINLWDS